MRNNYITGFCFKSLLIFIVLSTVVLNGFAATKRLVAGTHFDPKDPTVQYFPVIDESGNNDSKLFFFGNPEKQHFRATSQYPSYGGHEHRWLRYSTSSTLENNKYVCSTTDRITGGKDGDGYTFSKVNRDGFFFISKPGYNEYSVLGEFDMVGLAPGTVYDIEIGWYNISDTYWSGNDGARILVEVYSNGSFVQRFTWNDYVYANSGLQTSTATVTVPAGKNSLEVFIFNNYSKYRSMIAVDYILVYGQGLYITPDHEGPYPAGEEVTLTANDGTAPYTWYQSVDNGATYTVISGQTGSSITVSPTQRTIYKCVDAGKAEDTYEINPTVICDATKTKTLFSETFGTLSSETARSSTSYCPYTYIEACKPIKNGGEYAIVALPKWGGCGTQASDANSCNCTSDFWFNSKYDHTQGGLKDEKYGGMLMLNCNNIGDVLYERTVDVCSQSCLLFSVWVTAANISDVDPIKAKFVLRGGGKTGPVIDEYEVKNIDVNAGWKQISAMFNSGTYSQVTIQLVNLAPAGQKGNDLLIDDIEFKTCNPESYLYTDVDSERLDTVVICPASSGAQKVNIKLNAVIKGNMFQNPYFYWQKSENGT
ncbi:MAG: hypothetical protein MJ003_03865, partial [Paludibacteraceae bacterium]|nr:hypothetical protein [Paludibacteraceae bacterium]